MVKNNFPKLVKEAEFRYIWSFIYVLDKMILSSTSVPKEDYNKAFKFVKKNAYKIFTNPCFSFKRKFATAVFILSENLYKKMVRKNKEN